MRIESRTAITRMTTLGPQCGAWSPCTRIEDSTDSKPVGLRQPALGARNHPPARKRVPGERECRVGPALVSESRTSDTRSSKDSSPDRLGCLATRGVRCPRSPTLGPRAIPPPRSVFARSLLDTQREVEFWVRDEIISWRSGDCARRERLSGVPRTPAPATTAPAVARGRGGVFVAGHPRHPGLPIQSWPGEQKAGGSGCWLEQRQLPWKERTGSNPEQDAGGTRRCG
jgi:hypothetical protein